MDKEIPVLDFTDVNKLTPENMSDKTFAFLKLREMQDAIEIYAEILGLILVWKGTFEAFGLNKRKVREARALFQIKHMKRAGKVYYVCYFSFLEVGYL